MLSFVIPVYNKEKYISETLDSVVDVPDTEIILVDDRSTDKSAEICAQYSKKFPNIKLIYGEHSGVSAARNRGLMAAEGDYICFLDADDVFDRALLTEAVPVLYSRLPDIMIFDYVKFDNASNTVLSKNTLSLPDGMIDTGNADRFLEESFYNNIAFNVSNKFYKVSVIKENNLFFCEKISILEDVSFFLSVLNKSETVYYHKKYLHRYRIFSAGSLVTQEKNDYTFLLHFMDCFDGLYQHPWRLDHDTLDSLRFWTVYIYIAGIHEMAVYKKNRSVLKEVRKRVGRHYSVTSREGMKYFCIMYSELLSGILFFKRNVRDILQKTK